MPNANNNFPGRGLGRGRGRGRQPDGFGAGPGGQCACPSCGAKSTHQRGVPCYQQSRPKCGKPMVRE